MTKFYGQVKGMSKTAAARCGSMESHIKASVQSYDGSITMELSYGDDGALRLTVEHAAGSKMGGDKVYDGSVDEFLRLVGRG